MTVASLMMAIVLGAAPDVILLLLFGEANDRTMTTVMTLDRICDGLMGVPFIIDVYLRVRAEQFPRTPSLAETEHVPGAVDNGPSDRSLFLVHHPPEIIAENVQIPLFVLVMSAGLRDSG